MQPADIVAVRLSRDIPHIQSLSAAFKALQNTWDISQEALAHRANIGRTYIARMEAASNQSGLLVLFRLCGALEVTPSELLKNASEQ